MKLLGNSTIELIGIKKIQLNKKYLFVSIIYACVNSVQPKENYEEMETFTMALPRTVGHFQRLKSFMSVIISKLIVFNLFKTSVILLLLSSLLPVNKQFH